MTTNAEKTYVINGQLLADLPDRLVELVHGDEATPVVVDLRGNQPVRPKLGHDLRELPSTGFRPQPTQN